MAESLLYIVLLAGAGFLAGIAMTLVFCEHALSGRQRQQAQRERELAEFSSSLDDRLALLTGGGPGR